MRIDAAIIGKQEYLGKTAELDSKQKMCGLMSDSSQTINKNFAKH
jgi:hypothetical protein